MRSSVTSQTLLHCTDSSRNVYSSWNQLPKMNIFPSFPVKLPRIVVHNPDLQFLLVFFPFLARFPAMLKAMPGTPLVAAAIQCLLAYGNGKRQRSWEGQQRRKENSRVKPQRTARDKLFGWPQLEPS